MTFDGTGGVFSTGQYVGPGVLLKAVAREVLEILNAPAQANGAGLKPQEPRTRPYEKWYDYVRLCTRW